MDGDEPGVYRALEDLEWEPDDRAFLAWATLGLLPIVLMPVLCCSPGGPLLGVFFLVPGMARAGYTKFCLLQLVAAEFLLMLAGFLTHAAAVALARDYRLMTMWAALPALVLMLAALWCAWKRRRLLLPVIGPLVFKHFFEGQERAAPPTGGVYRS